MHNDRVKELEATVARQREQIIDYTHTNIELRRQVTTAKDYSFAGLASVFGNFVACVTTLASHGTGKCEFDTVAGNIRYVTSLDGFAFILTLHVATDPADTTTLVGFHRGRDFVIGFEADNDDTASTEFAWCALGAFMEGVMYPMDCVTSGRLSFIGD